MKAKHFELLIELFQSLAEVALEYDAALETAARQVSRLMDAICIVRLLSDDGRFLIPAAVYHTDPHLVAEMRESLARTNQTPEEGFPGQVFMSGQPLLLPFFVPDPIRAERERFYRGFNSLLIVPLRLQEEIVGTLAVVRRQESPPFMEEDQTLLQEVANRISLIIANARLHTQLQEQLSERIRTEEALRRSEQQYRALLWDAQWRARENRLLDKVRMALAGELDLPALFRKIVEVTADTFGYTLVSLYWLEDKTLVLQHQVGYPQVLSRISLYTGVMGRAVRTRQPIFVRDVREEPAFLHAFAGIQSEICVPLFDEGQAVGVFNIECTDAITLTEADLHLMGTLAAHLNQAITRARLYTEVRRNEERYRSVVDNAQEVICQLDAAGRYLFLNAAWSRMTGYTVTESLGRSRLMYIHPEDRSSSAALWQKLLNREQICVQYECRYQTKEGLARWNMVSLQTVWKADGELRYVAGMLYDFTDRKLAEQALHESEERFRTLVEHAPEAILLYDVDQGHFVAVNENAAKLFGYPRAALLTMSPLDISAARQPDGDNVAEMITGHINQVAAGEMPAFEWFFRRGDGQEIWCEVRLVQLPAAGRNLLRASVIDISLRKQEEEARQQRQRLESLGLLAGGIAHDFNNLLTGILGQSSLALARLDPTHAAAAHINKVVKSAERAADLTRQLLAYAGKGEFVREYINLNTFVRENEDLLHAFLPPGALLELQLAEDLPTIEADRGQIQQILMNLVINAGESVANGKGRITIRTSKDTVAWSPHRPPQELHSRLAPGEYVCLSIEDNGAGMDQETLRRAFDPFFSTKAQGRGLGLSAILGILRTHNGHIHVASKPGEGSTFWVFFPAQVQKAQVSETGGGYLMVKTDLVLVIDDEEPVREAVTDVLALADVETISAANGPLGIDLYRQRQTEISLVLLDLKMPVMSGEETLRGLKAINPDVKVVLSSGYNETEVTRQFAGLGVTGFLQKPYDIQGLLETVRKALEEHK